MHCLATKGKLSTAAATSTVPSTSKWFHLPHTVSFTVHCREHDPENFIWVVQLPKVRLSASAQAAEQLQPLSGASAGSSGLAHNNSKPFATPRPNSSTGYGCTRMQCRSCGCECWRCAHSSLCAMPRPGSNTRCCYHVQELRLRVLALRAFNLETLLIGEHVKSREPLVTQIRCAALLLRQHTWAC